MKLFLVIRRMFLLATSLLMAVNAQAQAIYCVRVGATGSGNGSDWNNARPTLPSPLVRGTTYYVADGTYSGYTFNTAVSGTNVVTVKKATVAEHGPSTGWQDSYGDGQAVFTGQMAFTSSYFVFDGVTGGGPGNWTGPYGFNVTVTANGTSLFSIGNSSTANNITIRHVEMVGKGSTSTAGGSLSNDGIAIYGDSNTTLSYAWMHGIGRCPVFYLGGGPSIFEYVYVESFFAGYDPNPHGELMSASQGAMNDVTWRYCLLAHAQSSGGLIWDNSGNTSSHLYIYGNVFYRPASDTWVESNGVIGGWTGGSGEQMHNVWVYNNTFINVNVKSLSPVPNIVSGNIVKNNIFYNCTSPDFTKFPTHDNNHFINSGGAHSEANGTSATSGDPFVNYLLLDFRLKTNTAAGAILGSPFDVDPLGRTRSTWSRGAYEFGSGTAGNQSPNVNAGTAVIVTMPVNTATLAGTATDPEGSPLTYAWSFVSGPGSVTFSSPASLTTVATFSSAGAYALRLTANDGANSSFADVSVTVNSQPLPSVASFQAEAGVISGAFATANGAIFQATTTGITDGGRAVYTFSVPTNGNYAVTAWVNAPSLTENTFYVNVDAEPTDPITIWDIQVTSGFENRTVSWRGLGAADANMLTPKVFPLQAGTHSLIVIGREGNAALDRFEIRSNPSILTPPSNLTIMAGQ